MDEQPKKMGRPRKELDFELIYKLAKIGCPMTEIASICKCSDDLLAKRARTVIKEGHDDMRRQLRSAQFQSAINGNVVMQIWLGKQILGQRDEKFIDKNVVVEKNGKILTPEEIKEKLAHVMKKKFGVELETKDG